MLSRLIYPTVILCAITLYFILKNFIPPLAAGYGGVTFGALCILFFEFYTPYKKAWHPTLNDIKNDALFLVLVQMILPKLFSFTLIYLFLGTLDAKNTLWPQELPIVIQAILMILIADFLRYWVHRYAHINKTLWKLHAVHHSPKKLYWLNVGRFHPLEKMLQFLFDALPFIVLGVSQEVLSLYFVFYAVNGFFQHSNIQLEMGFLNKIISSPQLHRWHHSKKIAEANNNYGNNIIIWDILFKSYYFPNDKDVESIGLRNVNYPQSFKAQMKTPFSGDIDRAPRPVQGVKNILINALITLKMILIKHTQYRKIIALSHNPQANQNTLLAEIINKNSNTDFGQKHHFDTIKNYHDFTQNVPIAEYEDLRKMILEQESTKRTTLTHEQPIIYNQTSGTTGKPKYIPLLKSSLQSLKQSQEFFSYLQYQIHQKPLRVNI
jgi:sterol desaturase/sphingolipid hydroxylase (fatty acid hydroxylase superfamily)